MAKNRKKHSRLDRRSYSILLAVVIVVLVIVGAWYLHRRSKPNFYANKTSNSQYQVHSSSNPGVTVVTGTPSSQSGTSDKNSNSSTSSTSSPPQAPVGTDLVSNYQVSLSKNATEQSSCNVQPGVTCNIEFTNGSQTISLGAEKANSDGYVIWDWTPQSIGLSVGNWTVKAIATLNGQQSSTTDANQLEVSQ